LRTTVVLLAAMTTSRPELVE